MEHGRAIGERAESRGLTGLRGLAALLVLSHHFYLRLALDVKMPMLVGLLRKGYLGVDLFFVISGFVMAMVYGSWFQRPDPGTARRIATFLLRRVARLWPLHVVVLAVLLALATLHGELPSWRTEVANFGMIQAWGISSEINAPAWSISTEFLAYLLFPLLAPAVLRLRFGVAVGLCCTVAALALCMHWAPAVGLMRRGRLDLYFNYSILPFLRCFAGFTLGVVTWRVAEMESVARWAARGWVGPTALLLMIALMLGRVNDLLIYLLLPVIVLGFHRGRGLGWRVLAMGPLHGLGLLSYSVYLVHYTMLTYFPFGWGPRWLELALFLLEVVAVAVVAHVLVERPGRRLINAAGEAALGWVAPLPPAMPGAIEALGAPPLQRDPGWPR